MGKKPFTILLGAAVASACLFGHVSTARADKTDAPQVEILVIHAIKCEKKLVDPAIAEPPPSMGYECMTLKQRKVVPIPVGAADTTKLPNGRIFQLVHTEHVGSRFKLTASINAPDGGWSKLADITADSNKSFNIGGWPHQNGIVLLKIKVLSPP